MIDIRKVCKIFLDFIYEEGILPAEIVKIIDETHLRKDPQYSIKWDIRVIFEILRRRENFKAGENTPTTGVQKEVAKRAYLLSPEECDDGIRGWMSENNQQITEAKNFCNGFFHNVDSEAGVKTFCTNLKELIKNFDKDVAQSYIEEIKNIEKQSEYKNVEDDLQFKTENERLKKELEAQKSKLNEIEERKKLQETSNWYSSFDPRLDKSSVYDRCVVAYCFSNYEHDSVYPNLNQDAAFIAAADKLNMKKNTIKRMRDNYDGNYRDIPYNRPDERRKIGRRVGDAAPLSPAYQKIKDEYDLKSKEEVIAKAKEILGLS